MRPSVAVRRAGADRPKLGAELDELGISVVDQADATLLYHLPDVEEIDEVTGVLVAWSAHARQAAEDGSDVITVIGADGFDSDQAAPAMLAHGAVAATRALAMERARDGNRANLIVAGAVAESEIAGTIQWLLTTPSVTAEILQVGGRRHGVQTP